MSTGTFATPANKSRRLKLVPGACAAILALLGACGQKGALLLPAPVDPAASPPQSEPSAEEERDEADER